MFIVGSPVSNICIQKVCVMCTLHYSSLTPVMRGTCTEGWMEGRSQKEKNNAHVNTKQHQWLAASLKHNCVGLQARLIENVF